MKKKITKNIVENILKIKISLEEIEKVLTDNITEENAIIIFREIQEIENISSKTKQQAEDIISLFFADKRTWRS